MRIVIAATAAIVITGCASSRLANVEKLTTDRTDVSAYRAVGEPIEKTSCSTFFALMLFGDTTSAKRLVEEALKESNADILINASLNSSYVGIAPLLSHHCQKIKGQPAVKQAAVSLRTPPS